MAGSQSHACECSDRRCPAHPGKDCSKVGRTRTLYRVDMEDRTGTRFCSACASDAMDSGLFADGPNFYSGGAR